MVNNHGYHRADRVADLIKREIGNILVRGDLDRDIGFVTVTNVELSKDLHNAKIFISVLGNADVRESEFNKLLDGEKRIRYLLAQRLNLRYTPTIKLYRDDSLDNSIRVQKLLDNIEDDDKQE